VVEADIVSYFDNIDQAMLKDKIRALIGNLPGGAAVEALAANILADQGRALGTPDQGLVQGSPLSPLLANLYLDALDEEIASEGVKIVRLADDSSFSASPRSAPKRTYGASAPEYGLYA
jgi:retron-type reverse transcriptase